MSDKAQTMGEHLPRLIIERMQCEARIADAKKAAADITASNRKRIEQLTKKIEDYAATPGQVVMDV